jgi:hypothetical protein
MESFEHKVNDFLEVLNHQNVSSEINNDLLDLSHGMLQSHFDDMNDDDDDEALEMTGKEIQFNIKKLSFFSNHSGSFVKCVTIPRTNNIRYPNVKCALHQ